VPADPAHYSRGSNRAIPCSAVAQECRKIVQNRLALVGEESVSGVTAEPPPGSNRDQNGKSDEIRIVCSGNGHQDPPNLDERPVGDASASAPTSVLQSDSWSHRLDRGYELRHGVRRGSLLAFLRHPGPARKVGQDQPRGPSPMRTRGCPGK